ncbi:hypothetical protein BDN71DRAFT_1455731 [Pleurotus eryngii]|uniref:DUF6535 domain-containing protein n=1 Tax=Pleurotus eryngii TaxID=5323 RepID=A0A9P6DBH0_PLEER|nr:hypothetical protein BDN71DRAFT_1455731 [Pleurotus eryngii]
MSIDADRGSHDVSSVPRPIGEETPRQSLVAKDAAADPHSNPSGHSVFGLKTKHSLAKPQNPSQPGYIDPHDYEKKYPEDAMFEELSENARVWRVYLDEATEFDADMVNKASDGLDLLLVFAGLFSAVLTTFLVQTSQSLSNDDAAVSVSLLSELVMIQRAMANGTSIESIPPAETTSGPSRSDVWVNGLWFISLTLSLSTALLAVLARQWLHQYTAITSGTPRDRSLIRQYRYDGLTKWRVLVLTSLLPVLLHIALGLFLVGLAVFLMPLNPAIAWTVAGITCLVYLIYMISNILPVVDPQCPYRTPFSDILHVISRRLVPSLLTPLWLSILHPSQVARQLATLFGLLDGIIRRATSGCISTFESLFSKQPEQRSSTSGARAPLKPWQPLKEIERQTANTEYVGARAIAWLLKSTSNPPTTSIALRSLGGSSPAMTKMLPGLMSPLGADEALSKAIWQILQSDPHQETSSETLRLERLLRSLASISPTLRMQPYYDALLGRRSVLDKYSFGSGGPWISNIVSSDIPLNAKVGLIAKPCAYVLGGGESKGNPPLQEAIFLGIVEQQPVSLQLLVKLYRKAFESGSASFVEGDGEFLVGPTPAPRDFMRELAMLFAYRQVSLRICLRSPRILFFCSVQISRKG